MPVSVNVSLLDIYDPEPENELQTIIKSNGLLPAEYLLEISGSAYTDNSRQIVETVELIIEISDFLGVPVIAEGVETEAQYLLLKKLGCEIIQGYYFSRPVPPEEFNALIEKDIWEGQNADS